ncbi:MAG: flippase-like domain-containing protein [Bacteroidales bacterium]|nr:flippase-like domain-containing protein [Bacteroidales bacterium]
MSRKRIFSILEYLFFLGIGVLLLWLSFRKLDLNQIWVDIREAEYSWLLIALFFAILAHILRALRWNLLIGSLGYKTRLTTTFFAVMIGYLANTAVPRMGEFVRCGVLSKKENIPFNSLFGTVISERLFDLISLFIIIFLVIVFQLDLVGDILQQMFGPLLQSIFSNVWSITFFLLGSLAFLALLLWLVWKTREKIKKLSFYQKLRDFIIGLWEGILTIGRMRQKGLFLLYTVSIWLFYGIMVYMPVLMLKETSHLSFLDGLTILAIGSLGIVAPVPGGIGAYHFIVKAILVELYHIEPNAAGSFAAITHAGQTLLNVAVGGLSYLGMGVLAKKQIPCNEEE